MNIIHQKKSSQNDAQNHRHAPRNSMTVFVYFITTLVTVLSTEAYNLCLQDPRALLIVQRLVSQESELLHVSETLSLAWSWRSTTGSLNREAKCSCSGMIGYPKTLRRFDSDNRGIIIQIMVR